jgi:hypothetical protein
MHCSQRKRDTYNTTLATSVCAFSETLTNWDVGPCSAKQVCRAGVEHSNVSRLDLPLSYSYIICGAVDSYWRL